MRLRRVPREPQVRSVSLATQIAILNLVALKEGSAVTAEETLAWAIGRGYVRQEGEAYFMTPKGTARIHEEIHRGVGL